MRIIFQDNFEMILEACQFMNDNRNNKAKRIVESFILDYIGIDTKSETLLAHIIAESLLKRIDRDLLETKNIYLQEFDIPQIILFYKMIEVYPHVSESHKIANQYLFSILKELKEVTIFDIGIGKGKQIKSLLHQISPDNSILKKVNIIALDPDSNNLNDSEINFMTLKNDVFFDINYYPYCSFIEELNDSDFKKIKELGNGNLLINSAFSMHHVAHPLNNTEYRTEIFRKIKNLNPLLFTLVEPNSNHDVENISKRLYNCWNHFGTVFNLIDHSKIEPEHKFLVKNTFFGREIKDMFGVSDYVRSERHESIESWLMRFIRSGFEPYNFTGISTNLPEDCNVSIMDGATSLGYKGMDLIGIFAYKPRN